MAYSRNKILLYGGAGIAIATLLCIFCLPVKTEIHVDPSVTLQTIPGYGIQTVMISEEQTTLRHLNLSLSDFEVKATEGKWTSLDVATPVSFNLLRDPETSITADVSNLVPGSYTVVRAQILGGLEYTNATLINGDVVSVDVPSSKVEFATRAFEVDEGTASLILVLRPGSRQLTTHILPHYHISTGTTKIEVARAGGFGIYLLASDELIISDLEIIVYNQTSHEIQLTDAGVEKIAGLQVPLNGTGFAINVEGEEIYRGAFWSPLSSLPYHGFVIQTPPTNTAITIEAGYPASQFQGEDTRNNRMIFEYLDAVGKLTD